jgi:16S rRNA G966 N2-methylase RsmD
MEQYINKKNSLRDLNDEQAQIILPNLAKLLAEHGFIYEHISDEDIQKDWKSLCKKSVSSNTIASTSVIGMKCIRKYMPHFYDVQNYKGVSIKSLWTEQNLLKALIFNRKYHSTPYVSEIVRSLAFTSGLGKITVYRPLMAKTVVSHFNAKSVLDVCVGWGGRMLGSSSIDGVSYTGIEPCVKTYQGLCHIAQSLKLDKVYLINKPAEEALQEDIPEDMRFDIGLTSPPYYNLEIYSPEDTQSLRYGTYDEWIQKFLRPVVIGVMKRVKYSCWSVKNFKTDKTYNLLDDIIKIHKEHNWKQLDITFSMSNSKRPGSGVKTKKAEEMTYVFVQS